MNRGAAAVTSVIAGVATDICIKDLAAMFFRPETGFDYFRVCRVKRAAANATEHAHEPLRQYAVQRGNKVVRLDAHVQKSADDVDHVVRVDRGENQVAG